MLADSDFLADVLVTTETLQTLLTRPELLRDKGLRDLRTVLHQLQAAMVSGKSLSGRVMQALDGQQWFEALSLLHAMRVGHDIPKLGW